MEIIDFGKIIIPSSWDEITLKQWQEINKYYKEKESSVDIREILHILTNKTIDEINELPMEFLETILDKLSFLHEEPKQKEPTNKIIIDGEIYQVNIQNKLKTGEYVAADTIIKQDPDNLAAILAIICRKEDEKYDSKFENEVLPERVKMFEEESVTEILPIISFFLQCYMLSNLPSQLFSKVEEVLNLTQQSIDSSQKIGVFKRCYLNWQMKKLKKSIKSIKNT